MASGALLEPIDTLLGMNRTKERTEFGQRLFDIRTVRGFSQAHLAQKCGMSQNNLSYLEYKGMGSPKVASLARVLQVQVRWLETGEGPRDSEDLSGTSFASPKIAEALAEFSHSSTLPKDYRTHVHTLAEVFEESGIELPVKRFLALADAIFDKLGGSRN